MDWFMRPKVFTCVTGCIAVLSACSVQTEEGSDVAVGTFDLASEPGPAGVEAVAESFAMEGDEARSHSLKMIAAARGWSYEEAARHNETTEAVGRIAEELYKSQPDRFVGSVAPERPMGPAKLLITGKFGAGIEELVRTESAPIEVVDGQPFSYDDMDERQDAVVEGLRDCLDSFVVSSDILDAGRITVKAEPGGSCTELDQRARIPAALRESTRIVAERGSVPRFANADGGGISYNQSPFAWGCTTGFNVRRASDGVEGVTTAGHCGTGYAGSWESNNGFRAVTPQFAHLGNWGDFGFMVEPSDSSQLDDFWVDSSGTFDCDSVESVAGLSLGESVCRYGRWSNVTDCATDVENTNETITINGTTVRRTVRMDGDAGVVGGDSGGPWFVGGKAYGTTIGWIAGANSWWSKAAHFGQLGVSVMTSP